MSLVASAAVLAAEKKDFKPLLPKTAEIIVGLVAFAILLWVLVTKVFPKFEALHQQLDTLHFVATARIEDAQLDFIGVGGEYREVDSFTVPRCSAGIGLSGPHRSDGPRLRHDLLIHHCVKAMSARSGMGVQSGRFPSS